MRKGSEWGGGVGGLWISGYVDIRRIFGGLKFLIAGIFGVGKFSKYFFGRLDLRRNFLRTLNNLKLSFCMMLLMTQKMFLGRLSHNLPIKVCKSC